MQRSGRLLLLALSILPAGGVVYTSAQKAAIQPTPLPPARGVEVTQKLCTTCHPVDSFNGLRRNVSDWTDTVTVMVAYGAQMNPAETAEVVGYLGRVFGPDSPPLVDANRAERKDFAKLPGLDAAAVDALLGHRQRHGRFESLQQVEAVVGAARFERVKGYLVVRATPPTSGR